MLQILHFGDMHLDAPYAAVGMAAGERLREGLRRVLNKITGLAAECDLVLISGNLFESGYVLPETLGLVRDAFAALPCPVVIAPGNADPYAPGGLWTSAVWSDNVLIFKKDTVTPLRFELPRTGTPVTVWGWAFTSDRMSASPLTAKDGSLPFVPDAGRLNLLCAHADLCDDKSLLCPTDPGAVLRSGVAYAALGAPAQPDVPLANAVTAAAVCGTPEAHSFGEAIPEGILLVTVDEDAAPPVTVDRVQIAAHRYRELSLDVSGCLRDDDLVRRLSAALAERKWGNETSLRVTLTGTLIYDHRPAAAKIAAQVQASLDAARRLCSLTVIDRTLPAPDASEPMDEPDVRGEFYRTLFPLLSSADAERKRTAAAAIRAGLIALDGGSVD